MYEGKGIKVEPEEVLGADNIGAKRIGRLKRQVLEAKQYVCMQRARIVTEAYRETENMPAVSRRAYAFRKIVEQMDVYILPDELIVGHQASKHRSAPVFPEFAVEWIKEELDIFEMRAQDPFIVPKEEKELFLKEIYPYWKGKTLSDKIRYYMPEEMKRQRYDAGIFSLGIHEEGGFGHVLPDYEKVIRNGLRGIIAECEQAMKQLKLWDTEDIKKKLFYEAVISYCESCILFAQRYGEEAQRKAQVEQDAKRKKELEKIAKVCENVPANPARDFWEALQSCWFMQLLIQINDNGVAVSPGRIDQYFYPYYARDVQTNRLSREEAQELLEAYLIKFAEPLKIYSAADAAIHAGFPMGQIVCVGGMDARGKDATNDLTYRVLEAHRHIGFGQPNLTVRVHLGSPQAYMEQIVKTIQKGSGMPQIASDEVFIPALLNIGVPLKEARNYGLIGCIEGSTTNTWGRTNGGYFNIAKYIELALNNGKCPLCGEQVGIETGDAAAFTSYEQVEEAFHKQMSYGFELLAGLNNICDLVHEQFNPVPIVSMLVGGCISRGKDVTSGGADHNWTGPLGVGIADTGNSLYALKKCVFEQKKFDMKTMLDALKNNFEGYEVVQAYLEKKVEKYGNDMEEVDELTAKEMDYFFDEMEKYTTHRGGPFVASLLPVASYVAFGQNTGALPDGRKAKMPLADGISPNVGTDLNGPTAVLKSVTRIDHRRCPNGVIFNQKFSPTIFESKEGVQKFVDYIRTYMVLGGGHVQFNIVSADTLKRAQVRPEEYPSLVVRVAGYSAFFNELSREVQDTIIERTENMQ